MDHHEIPAKLIDVRIIRKGRKVIGKERVLRYTDQDGKEREYISYTPRGANDRVKAFIETKYDYQGQYYFVKKPDGGLLLMREIAVDTLAFLENMEKGLSRR